MFSKPSKSISFQNKLIGVNEPKYSPHYKYVATTDLLLKNLIMSINSKERLISNPSYALKFSHNIYFLFYNVSI